MVAKAFRRFAVATRGRGNWCGAFQTLTESPAVAKSDRANFRVPIQELTTQILTDSNQLRQAPMAYPMEDGENKFPPPTVSRRLRSELLGRAHRLADDESEPLRAGRTEDLSSVRRSIRIWTRPLA